MTSSAEWRTNIQDVDVTVLEFLKTRVNGGFDEKKYGARVGFGNLKRQLLLSSVNSQYNHCRFLEAELAKRYKDAAPSTLAILNERCVIVNADLEEATARLASMQDVCHLRKNGRPSR